MAVIDYCDRSGDLVVPRSDCSLFSSISKEMSFIFYIFGKMSCQACFLLCISSLLLKTMKAFLWFHCFHCYLYYTLRFKSSGVCYWITHRKQLLHYFWITPLHDLECIITPTLTQIPILAHVIFLLVFCMNTKTTTQSNRKPAKVTSKRSPQWFYLRSIYRQKVATVAQAGSSLASLPVEDQPDRLRWSCTLL